MISYRQQFFIVLMLLVNIGFCVQAQERNIYIKNTGDEGIYAAAAHRYVVGLDGPERTQYKGWFFVKPGDKKYIGTMTFGSRFISIAFSKKNGYIKYSLIDDDGKPYIKTADSIYVDSTDGFDYINVPPLSFLPIPVSITKSFGLSFGEKLEIHETINVPSKLTDKVIPWDPLFKKRVMQSFKEMEASANLAPEGSYKTKKGEKLSDIFCCYHQYTVTSYITKTNLFLKEGELLSINLVNERRMTDEYIKKEPQNLNEYKVDAVPRGHPPGMLYVRIGSGPWKLLVKDGELKATSGGELQFMVNEKDRHYGTSKFYWVNVKRVENQ